MIQYKCTFLVLSQLGSIYKQKFFPICETYGYSIKLINTVNDSDRLLNDSKVVIVDRWEFLKDIYGHFHSDIHIIFLSSKDRKDNKETTINESTYFFIEREGNQCEDFIMILPEFENILHYISYSLETDFFNHPWELLKKEEHSSAIVSSFSNLQIFLKQTLNIQNNNISLEFLIKKAKENGILSDRRTEDLQRWRPLRNKSAHESYKPTSTITKLIVKTIDSIIKENDRKRVWDKKIINVFEKSEEFSF